MIQFILKMKTGAKSFVTIMIVIAISALLLRIVLERLIAINIAQNESNAQSRLKLISAALENYAKDNKGIYPATLSLLTQSSPAYLDKDYVTQFLFKGYSYNCPRLDSSGYRCVSLPLRCKLTGNAVYAVTTGGLLVSEPCEKKEQ